MLGTHPNSIIVFIFICKKISVNIWFNIQYFFHHRSKQYETHPLDVSLLIKGLPKEHRKRHLPKEHNKRHLPKEHNKRHHGLGDLNMANNIKKRKQTRDVSHYDLAIYIKKVS
jgi:hypothetical protein